MSGGERSLFVYGTLMPGEIRWPLLQPHAVERQPATAKGKLWDTGFGYPAARFEPSGADIPGVLVTLATDAVATVIAVLDRVEGEGTLFRRVEVVTSGGPAMSYEWMGPTEGLLPLVDGWSGRP